MGTTSNGDGGGESAVEHVRPQIACGYNLFRFIMTKREKFAAEQEVRAMLEEIEAQAVQVAELTRRIAELEPKPGQPPKNPDNSSGPPSQGRKANHAKRRAAKKRKDRPVFFGRWPPIRTGWSGHAPALKTPTIPDC
jgi:hypothetical protein